MYLLAPRFVAEKAQILHFYPFCSTQKIIEEKKPLRCRNEVDLLERAGRGRGDYLAELFRNPKVWQDSPLRHLPLAVWGRRPEHVLSVEFSPTTTPYCAANLGPVHGPLYPYGFRSCMHVWSVPYFVFSNCRHSLRIQAER